MFSNPGSRRRRSEVSNNSFRHSFSCLHGPLKRDATYYLASDWDDFNDDIICGGFNMCKKIVFSAILILQLFVAGNKTAYGDDAPQLITPTPGTGPGGRIDLPLPDIGTKDEIIAQFNIPSADELQKDSKIEFTWDLNNWILWAQASKAGLIFGQTSTFGIFTIVIILLIVLVVIHSIADSVYGAGSRGYHQIREEIIEINDESKAMSRAGLRALLRRDD